MNKAMKCKTGIMCAVISCDKSKNRLFSKNGFAQHLKIKHHYDSSEDIHFAERNGIFIWNRDYSNIHKRIEINKKKYKNIPISKH